MEGFELTTQLVRFEKSAKDWEDAIRIATKDLLAGGYIKESYVDGIIDCVKEFGPYIVIAPDIALPHARPEKGAIRPGLKNRWLLKRTVRPMPDCSFLFPAWKAIRIFWCCRRLSAFYRMRKKRICCLKRMMRQKS